MKIRIDCTKAEVLAAKKIDLRVYMNRGGDGGGRIYFNDSQTAIVNIKKIEDMIKEKGSASLT